jgi:hypothetical protein
MREIDEKELEKVTGAGANPVYPICDCASGVRREGSGHPEPDHQTGGTDGGYSEIFEE